jgi:hypothetical protein
MFPGAVWKGLGKADHCRPGAREEDSFAVVMDLSPYGLVDAWIALGGDARA